MLTSNAAPMLAAVSAGSVAGACSWFRQDRITDRGYHRGYTVPVPGATAERRALKRAERRRVDAEVAADLWADAEEAREVAEDTAYEAWLAGLDADDPYANCSCELCDSAYAAQLDAMLAEALEADPLVYDGDLACWVPGSRRPDLVSTVARLGADRYDLDDDDLPGYGEARVDYSEFGFGFHIEAGIARATGRPAMRPGRTLGSFARPAVDTFALDA